MAIGDQIVADIIRDLTERAGLQEEWERIDEEVRLEIKQKWATIVYTKLVEESRNASIAD
jgi:hypothetical protein